MRPASGIRHADRLYPGCAGGTAALLSDAMSVDACPEEVIPALPPGTRFGELEILGTLGIGGFGIVYLARDHSLEREVAIKEYMPSQFALRDGQSHVSVRSMSMKETFDLGRRSFVNEAKLLARFDHPSLLKVYRFWEAHGTAYMAMPRLVGQNLREARRSRPTPPPEAWVRRIFDAVLGGLETLHAQNVWHRDVAPDNIFLPADGSPPILLDFGAARQAIGDRTQVFTAILKPSFAPIEQYAEATSLRQGPWTDFYALAAAVHELLIGRPPPPATARAMGDELPPLAVPGYSPHFLAALEWALRVPPHQRPQSAAEWREVIEGRAPVPPALLRTVPPPVSPSPAEPLDLEFADTIQGPDPDEDDTVQTVVVPLKPAAPPPAPKSAPEYAPPSKSRPPAAASPPPAASAPPAPRRALSLPVMAGGGVVALLLLGLFITQLRGKPDKPETPAPESATTVVAPAPASPEPAAPVAQQPAPLPLTVETSASAVPQAARLVPTPASPSAKAASGPVRREAASRPIVQAEKPGDVRTVPRSPVFAAPEPAAPAPLAGAATSKPPAGASAPAGGEPHTAAEACSGRMLLARAWCVDRQCEKPIYQNDPECVKLREIRSNRGGGP